VITVDLLRELLRNLAYFRSLHQNEGISVIPTPEGDEISIFDIEYLYENLSLIPPRRALAIELFLVRNMMERETAIAMGVSPNNPMGSECTKGLRDLLQLIEEGALSRFRVGDTEEGENVASRD
jgi:hypothetical protein